MTFQDPTFSLIDELRNIIDPQNIYSGDTQGNIILGESSPKSKCKSFKLHKSERIKTLTLNGDIADKTYFKVNHKLS